jgi:hypothetical protein
MGNRPLSIVAWLPVIFVAAWSPGPGIAHLGHWDENRSPTVGAPGRIENLLLPGSQLVAKPLTDDRSPIVLRIEHAFAHGDLGFRYDLVFFGMTPGRHDLRDYLQRADGTSLEGVPEIAVEIRSLLPPGQVEPNSLTYGRFQRLGGYSLWIAIGAIVWCWVLAGLILLGWRRRRSDTAAAPRRTLAELLYPRLQAAWAGRLEPKQYAELERMLTAFWKRRLGLHDLPPDEVIRRIRSDEQSGSLMRQLEQWMHSPQRDPAFDLAELLRPLEKWSADEFEAIAGSVPGDETPVPSGN